MKCSTKTTRPISSILPSSPEPSVSPARPTPKEFAPLPPLSGKPPHPRSRGCFPMSSDHFLAGAMQLARAESLLVSLRETDTIATSGVALPPDNRIGHLLLRAEEDD